MVADGDELITTIGRYITEVRQIQDMDIELQSGCAGNVWGGGSGFIPSHRWETIRGLDCRVIPELHGRIPDKVGNRGLLRELQKSREIATKYRRLIGRRDALYDRSQKLEIRRAPPAPIGLRGKDSRQRDECWYAPDIRSHGRKSTSPKGGHVSCIGNRR